MTRLAVAMAAGIACGAGWLLASACGGAKIPVRGAVPGSGPSSSAAVAAVPSDATPIHVEFSQGGCHVVVDDSPGGSYKAAGDSRGLEQTMAAVLQGCLSAGQGRHGILHVRAGVQADGTLAEVMVVPGGALANDVGACVANAMARVRLPAPTEPGQVVMVMLTSSCADHGAR
jgi:hypothetical protein